MYPINWKSNFAAADEGVNFRTDFEQTVRKGDMLIREDGEIFILAWAVHRQVNNQPSQAKKCNFSLTIERVVPETVDELGYVAVEAGTENIVTAMPSCIFQYDGRPDYAPGFNTPGIAPDNLTIVECQYNPQTALIRINDTFLWGTSTFRVINLNPTGLNIAGTAGLLQLHARRVAGGEVDGT